MINDCFFCTYLMVLNCRFSKFWYCLIFQNKTFNAMKKDDFIAIYLLDFNYSVDQGKDLITFVTTVKERSTGRIVRTINDELGLTELNDWLSIANSSSLVMDKWDALKFFDSVIRFQLDNILKMARVSDCFPLNKDVKVDVFYK